MKIIKGVEKLLLSTFFPSDELNIIYQEKVFITVVFAEGFRRIMPEGVDKVVGSVAQYRFASSCAFP